MVPKTHAETIDDTHFRQFYIGGQWTEPSSNRVISVVSPSTEEVVFRVAEAVEADVDLAVAAARDAFENGPWPRLTPAQRAEYLTELARLLRERAEDLTCAWIESTGVLAAGAEAGPMFAMQTLDQCVEQLASFEFIERHVTAFGGPGLLVREPVGVVAAVAPWNAALAIMIGKIGPALLAGCTVVMKPAPQAPIDAYIIAECASLANFPAGVLNLITAERDASDHLIRHADVDKVSFTGSVETGRHVASVCGERIARVTLELGGKSAAIVLDDYDLDKATESIATSICSICGQTCIALSRVLVSRQRHDALVEKLKVAFQAMKPGDPRDPGSTLGPLTLKQQREKVEHYIAKGIDEGATLVTGGKRPTDCPRGYYIEPTLFANVDNAMSIAQEEIFGPVLCVIPYDDEDDAVRIANDSIFGLHGAVYTNDTQAAYRIARRLRTGGISQNHGYPSNAIAFGGFKQSGLGREGGREGLLAYLETKTILLQEEFTPV
jgi:aldehyde dehydrogenase (NAD+)